MDSTAESAPKDKETVKVVVRCRPLFGKEIVEGRKPIITLDTAASIISIKCPENDQIKSFTFDSVYDERTSQRQFYDESGYPLVESIFEGYNGTIFAYGQTGCGKTHTMQGKDSPPELRGVIPHSFDHIFDTINADPTREYMVRASYLEIYNEDIRDLLGDDSKKKLDLKEGADGSVYVKDLTEVVVSDVDSMNRVMNRGFKNRTVGATLMNEGSSRSHSIFTVVVETSEKIGGQDHFKAGKLNLVDLAGSERQSKTGATGSRLKEGCKINLSLSALGNVISALVDGKGKHIPYRDSKLTRLLQDSLGGNTKTLMVAAVSPADYNYDETLSTLRYANRAKNIKNKPIVNEDPKDAKLREYKEEIERLKQLLEAQARGSAPGSAGSVGIATPTRPLTPQPPRRSTPPEVETRAANVAVAEANEAALAKEREDIAKYQREAADMLETAKRMMEEAQAMQEQQRQAATLLEQEVERSKASSMKEAEASVSVVERRQEGGDASTLLTPRPEPLAEKLLSALPPVASPRAAQQIPEPGVAQSPPLSSSSTRDPASATPPPQKEEPPKEDPAIALALSKAAQVDAQAREMMARAELMMKEAEQRAKQPPKVKIVKEVVVKEVIPEEHMQEKNELKERNQNIMVERDQMGKELERTQQTMETYMREKEDLRNKLKKIESQILGGSSSSNLGPGHQPLVSSEIALLKQQVDYRRAQIKLRDKAKKEAQNEAARRALAMEKQMIEIELTKAQEVAQTALLAAKKKEAKYKAKLELARQEIVDVNNEFERERENLLDTIREQTKETKLLEQLAEIFLPQNELVKVWERAVWVEEREEWQLPKLKPRSDFQKIKLPTLTFSGGGGDQRPPSGYGEQSGGVEVVSDDESMPPNGHGSSTVRSSSSSGNTKRRKHSTKGVSSTDGYGSKPSSSNDAGLMTMRSGENALQALPPYHQPHQPLQSSRLLSPEMGRLPSAVRSSRMESGHDDSPQQLHSSSLPPSKKPSSSSSTTASSSGGIAKERRKNKDSRESERYFPPPDDLLSPLNGEYQPRDRLQSRQGSRQGARSSDGLSSANSKSQTSLGEFDAPLGADEPEANGSHRVSSSSRDSNSRSGHGSRRHRDRKERQEETTTTADDDDWKASGAEGSPDASLIKKKDRKHKKKKDRKEKHASSTADEAASETNYDSRTNSGSHYSRRGRSPEEQDPDY